MSPRMSLNSSMQAATSFSSIQLLGLEMLLHYLQGPEVVASATKDDLLLNLGGSESHVSCLVLFVCISPCLDHIELQLVQGARPEGFILSKQNIFNKCFLFYRLEHNSKWKLQIWIIKQPYLSAEFQAVLVVFLERNVLFAALFLSFVFCCWAVREYGNNHCLFFSLSDKSGGQSTSDYSWSGQVRKHNSFTAELWRLCVNSFFCN